MKALERLVGSERASIPQVLRARVERTPDAHFLRFGDQSWSYGEAFEEIERFSGLLRDLGTVGQGARVASYLSNRPETIWACLGTHCAGLTYVCLNREHRGVILSDMLARSGASVLITESEALGLFDEKDLALVEHLIVVGEPIPSRPEGVGPGGVNIVPYADTQDAKRFSGTTPEPGDPATLMFTSGTTGRSKAVLLPHNQFCRGASHLIDRLGIHSDDVFHGWLPLYHIGAQLHIVVTSILAGASIFLLKTFSLSRFWSEVEASGATIFICFPNVLKLLWADPPTPGDARRTLRLGIVGGIPTELDGRFQERFDLRLADAYGMTEAEILTLPPIEGDSPPGSCGLPGPDFDLTILDPEDRELGPGQVGEIAVRPRVSDVMMLEYEGDEEATLHACRNGWFHTGDLGSRDERGFVYFAMRSKHAIRRRGENISSHDVEAVLHGHPAIGQAAAVGVPSPLGEDDLLVAVVLEKGATLTARELHEYCQKKMARFMVPRFIDILSDLPESDVGKIQLGVLRDRWPSAWDSEAARG